MSAVLLNWPIKGNCQLKQKSVFFSKIWQFFLTSGENYFIIGRGDEQNFFTLSSRTDTTKDGTCNIPALIREHSLIYYSSFCQCPPIIKEHPPHSPWLLFVLNQLSESPQIGKSVSESEPEIKTPCRHQRGMSSLLIWGENRRIRHWEKINA